MAESTSNGGAHQGKSLSCKDSFVIRNYHDPRFPVKQQAPKHHVEPPVALPGTNPDVSPVECVHIQGIRAVDVVIYLNALITQKMGALSSPEGWENEPQTINHML